MRGKNRLTGAIAIFAVIMMVSCGSENGTETTGSEVTSEEVKQEAKEAVETAAAYTQQQKEDYVRKMETRLNELGREMEQLKAKTDAEAAELTEEGKAAWNMAMDTLNEKKQAASERLEKLKAAGGESWADIKSGLDSAMADLNAAFDKAASNFAKM